MRMSHPHDSLRSHPHDSLRSHPHDSLRSSISIALATGLVGLSGLTLGAGCANDPVYIPAPEALEAGFEDTPEARAELLLPIKTESADDARDRGRLAAELDPIEVPYVRVGDLEIMVEWTLRNLGDEEAEAIIQVNGANEFYAYDPTMILLYPEEDDSPPTPGLVGDIPIHVPAGATLSGLFTEDELREAAIDLDQVTRGNINPFRAALTISKNAPAFQPLTAPLAMPPEGENAYDGQMPEGPEIPREAFAGLTRVDIVLKATRHLRLEYNVRVRDLRGILHELLLAAEDDAPDELATFMPMPYVPVPVTAP
jgi:hypothetical protein